MGAALLPSYSNSSGVVVLGLPRGGVPVAFVIAKMLGAPLDVFLVRKLGVPGFEELAMGAIASGGIRVVNEDVLRGVPKAELALEQITALERQELARREAQYRKGRPILELFGRIVILVDDGLATGATMRAAVAAVRTMAPRRVVVAIPVGSVTACAKLREEADEVICALEAERLEAVGQFYEQFTQTTDAEVCGLLGG